MKKTLIFVSMFCAFQLKAQNLDSLFNAHVLSYEPEGYVIFKPNTLPPGMIFTVFSDYYAEYPNNKFELVSTTNDEILGWVHHKYQQTYLGKKVEGAEFVEHTNTSGFVDFINGKVVRDFRGNPWESTMAEETALQQLLAKLNEDGEHTFSWMDEEWEESYRIDMDDPQATSYPRGELLWALHRFDSLGHFIPAEHYTLAWKFEIFSLNPGFQKIFFVDAITGEVFRVDDIARHDGPANIMTLGTRTIDTRWYGGLVNKHILHTNDGGRNIETRYDNSKENWGGKGHITDADDDWGNSHQLATTPHYMASQAWNFFRATYGRDGLDNDWGKVRIVADVSSWRIQTLYGIAHMTIGSHKADYIYVGYKPGSNVYAAAIDLVGHEFTHGLIRHTAKLDNKYEAGAIAESFCDIFGTMIEKREANAHSGVTFDWSIGEDIGTPIRYMQFPVVNTYLGSNWEHIGNCPSPNFLNDWCGIHNNNGPMNYWFYLLSEGGSGTNDNGLNYSVTSIGMDNAARIAYGALIFPALTSTSGYLDVRQATLNTARLLHGECSMIYNQVERAWAAVGVGMPKCTTMGIDKLSKSDKPLIFPNPSLNSIFVKFTEQRERTINIYTINGTLLKSIKSSNNEISMNLGDLKSGIYIIQSMDENNVYTEKLIKQ